MTKSRRNAKEQNWQNEVTRTLQQQLDDCNDAYTRGAFKYLRFLVHLLGALQFTYATYYYYTQVDDPRLKLEELDEETKRAHWAGKFKFLTFLDVILQALYHSVALLNDCFGANTVQTQSNSLLRRMRDFIFTAWAFPIAINVALSFWIIYAFDRELIFPSELDVFFPNWLNHVVHTNVALMCVMDLFTCCRHYADSISTLLSNIGFMLAYIVWMHVVHHFAGQWAYPLLEILNLPLRYLMLSCLLAFSVLCYFLGKALNDIVWSTELKMLREKQKLS